MTLSYVVMDVMFHRLVVALVNLKAVGYMDCMAEMHCGIA